MPYRFFTVPIQDDGTAENVLNCFIASRKVLAVDRRWVEQGPASFWAFCVDYLDRTGRDLNGSGPGTVRGKVDYKDVLAPEEFAIFSRLRNTRKEIAQSEAVPVYTVFTNEQLARMVQGRVMTKAALEGIVGIGDARVAKYGERILATLLADGASAHAASDPAI